MHITWGRAVQGDMEGVRISFVFDQYVDEYQFFDQPDIEQIMSIVTRPNLVPELLLVLIRNRLNLTVH